MNTMIFNILIEVLQNRNDVESFRFKAGDFQSIYYEREGTEDYNNALFVDLSDSDAISLMRFFLNKDESMCWNLNLELAKLLALKGSLLDKEVSAFLNDNSDKRWSEYFLHQAFYGSSLKYENKIMSLLEESHEDGRDGIFIACYKLNTPRIYQKLVECFKRWMQDSDWDSGTGEYFALLQFISLWDKTIGFNQHKKLILFRQ